VLFSALKEQQLGLALDWDHWASRILQVSCDAKLIVKKQTNPQALPELKGVYDLTKVIVTYLGNNTDSSHSNREVGLLLDLKTKNGHDTQVRFIMSDQEVDRLFCAIREVATDHNLDNLRYGSITEHVAKSTLNSNQSIMRKSIARAIEQYDSASKKEKVLSRRGAMKWLPVLESSDLVHGSWYVTFLIVSFSNVLIFTATLHIHLYRWFVIGSLLFSISSALVLGNSFDAVLGEDDSILSQRSYRAAWLLMTISGVFCTLGNYI
jgi:hypothetical protein